MPLQLFRYPDGAAAFYMTVLTFLPVPAQRAGAEFTVTYAMMYQPQKAGTCAGQHMNTALQPAPSPPLFASAH